MFLPLSIDKQGGLQYSSVIIYKGCGIGFCVGVLKKSFGQ